MGTLSNRVEQAKTKLQKEHLHRWTDDLVDAAPVERNKFYEREGDMSGSRLRVLLQNDGDVIVSITDEEEGALNRSVEFCTNVGGGRSSNTRLALEILARAIALDNKEMPPFPDA